MVLKGSMSMEQRDRMIDAFTNDASVTVFLMSLKAGGVRLLPVQMRLRQSPCSACLKAISALHLAVPSLCGCT